MNNTNDKFLIWLNKELEMYEQWDNAVKAHEISIESSQYRMRVRTLKQVKEKYILLNETDRV